MVQKQIATVVDDLMAQLPDARRLSSSERRGIIARYTAVLEGNFIYWMTATYVAVQSEEARPILMENLYEEVRDSHPVMLRRFAMAAHAIPNDTDALAVDQDMTKVRLFLGKLQAVPSLVTMAFFESFIQRFMPYLAELARAQGSSDMVYTDVHGVCDVTHSQELFHAVAIEMAQNPTASPSDLFQGVDLLSALIRTIVHGQA
jgi:hypothetical protein